MTTQFVLTCYPNDSITVRAEDIADKDDVPITSGVTGTLTGYAWDDDSIAIAATPLDGHASNAWWTTVEAPDVGRYRLLVVLQTIDSQRTLRGELRVLDPLA